MGQKWVTQPWAMRPIQFPPRSLPTSLPKSSFHNATWANVPKHGVDRGNKNNSS